MANDYSKLTVVTKPAILSFPSLFKARPKFDKTPDVLTYQAVAILPPSFDLAPLKAAVNYARTEMERKGVMAPNRRVKENCSDRGNPIRKSEDRTKVDAAGKPFLPMGFEPGGHFLTLHSKNRPTLVDEQVQAEIDENKFYAGCWCIFHLGAFVWENAGKWGVSFGLNGVQFVKDGERLGGSKPDIAGQFQPIGAAAKPVTSGKPGPSEEDVWG